MLKLSRLDAWITTVSSVLFVMRHVDDINKKVRGNILRVSTYFNGSDNVRNVHVCGGMGPDDLTVRGGCEMEGGGRGTEEESKEREFRKSHNTCVPVYIPGTAYTYLSIRSERVTRFVRNELGKIYD